MRQKRVLAVHDISGVGKCSLTVALPILSACGINTGILPTAILSTHTGEFENFVVHDTSDYLMPIARHLKEADTTHACMQVVEELIDTPHMRREVARKRHRSAECGSVVEAAKPHVIINEWQKVLLTPIS